MSKNSFFNLKVLKMMIKENIENNKNLFFLLKSLQNSKKGCNFAAQKQNGALDEWLSQRSAKPSTAVRIRQAPQE